MSVVPRRPITVTRRASTPRTERIFAMRRHVGNPRAYRERAVAGRVSTEWPVLTDAQHDDARIPPDIATPPLTGSVRGPAEDRHATGSP
jgi:hypothetical protein